MLLENKVLLSFFFNSNHKMSFFRARCLKLGHFEICTLEKVSHQYRCMLTALLTLSVCKFMPVYSLEIPCTFVNVLEKL